MSKEKQNEIKTAADLKQDSHNYRKHSDTNKARIKKSIDEAGLGRSVVIDADGVLVAGNGVQSVIDKDTPVKVVETDGTELVVVKRTDLHTGDPRRKTLALADNATADDVEWDFDAIAEDWTEDEAGEWGVEWPADEEGTDEEIIKRKEAEFKQRMEAGEDLSEDEEYLEFLDKFKAKKTTDDCYTPAIVYEAVAKWVENEYKVSRKDFVRPFYPGGDYKAEKYPKGCVVVDNPPFSILAEILNFYKDNGVRFFLFAPTLTLFSSSSSSLSTALPCGAAVIYENGASVNTSFLTNLEDRAIRFKSCPNLYQAVQAASDEYAKELHKELPKYSYPDYVVTAAFVARLSKYGIPFEVSVGQSCAISSLDSQRDTKKAIYGKGYLVSEKAAAEKAAAEKAAAEKAAAEKAAAEKAAATQWTLSDRERAIIAKLSKNDSNGND